MFLAVIDSPHNLQKKKRKKKNTFSSASGSFGGPSQKDKPMLLRQNR